MAYVGLPEETRVVARQIELYDSIDSTSERAKALLAGGAPNGMTVVAKHQKAGKGQRGRSWDSPKESGLYVSYVIRPKLALSQAPLLTMTTAVALASAIQTSCGFGAAIKWPNDLIAPQSRKKLAGILVELNSQGDRLLGAVIGIGLNLKEYKRPEAIRDYATSLEAETGSKVPAAEVFEALCSALEAELQALESEGEERMMARWLERCAGIGEMVTVLDGKRTIQGRLRGIDAAGALLVEQDGEQRRFHSAELRLEGAPYPGDR